MLEPRSLDAARDAHARIADAVMALPGVHGVAVGEKQTGGAATGELCVVVFVDKKRPPHQLAAHDLVPGVVPGTTIPTDVVEYPRVIAQVAAFDRRAAHVPRAIPEPRDEADTARCATLVGGAQIQAYAHRGAVGTLGTVLYDTRHRRLLGLSNWHALHAWPSPGAAGDAIYQPSFSVSNHIGTAIAGAADGVVDAAIFSVAGRPCSLDIQDIGAWSGKLGAVPLGLPVMKRGRTTRLTHGTVKYVHATLQVSYGTGRAITYTGLIGVGPRAPGRQFSAPGDSGAVVVDSAGKRLVSLHFAGNATDGWGCPIDAVERALDFRVEPDTTDTGVFSTADVRAWDMPRRDNARPVVFAQPCSAPPRVAVGLTELDAASTADLRIAATARNVTATGFTAALDARADTVLYRAASTWLEVAPDDPDFQIGTLHTQLPAPLQTAARRIDFDRRYAAPPAVVVWLNALEISNRANARVRAHVTDIDAAGFTLHIESWADTALHAAGVTWIAHPATAPNLASGTFSTLDVRPWNQPRAVTTGTVRFPAGLFAAPPRVLVALNALDIDRQANLRITSSVSSVSATGMTWSLDSWADTKLYSAGASYLAIGRAEA